MTTEMKHKDWFVDEPRASANPRPITRPWDLLREHYYLHQFLSDILDILASAPPTSLNQWDYLPQIRRRVRQLIVNSYWMKTQRGMNTESQNRRCPYHPVRRNRLSPLRCRR